MGKKTLEQELEELDALKKIQKQLKIAKKPRPYFEDRVFELKRKGNEKGFRFQFSQVLSSSLIHQNAIPVYRKDDIHYTPAFCLPDEFNDTYRFTQRQLFNAQVEKQKQRDLEDSLIVPKETNNYCSICKINYKDYLDHVNETEHIQKLIASPFTHDILELTKKYHRQMVKIEETQSIMEEEEPEVNKKRENSMYDLFFYRSDEEWSEDSMSMVSEKEEDKSDPLEQIMRKEDNKSHFPTAANNYYNYLKNGTPSQSSILDKESLEKTSLIQKFWPH